MQVKHMQVKHHWVVFIKLGQKHASKDGIELAVFVAFGEVLFVIKLKKVGALFEFWKFLGSF